MFPELYITSSLCPLCSHGFKFQDIFFLGSYIPYIHRVLLKSQSPMFTRVLYSLGAILPGTYVLTVLSVKEPILQGFYAHRALFFLLPCRCLSRDQRSYVFCILYYPGPGCHYTQGPIIPRVLCHQVIFPPGAYALSILGSQGLIFPVSYAIMPPCSQGVYKQGLR